MEKPKMYLTLGVAASLFSDPISGTTIANKQIVEVDEDLLVTSPKIKSALQHGHIARSTEAEYEAYQATLKEPTDAAKGKNPLSDNMGGADDQDSDDDDDELEEMTKTELMDAMKEAGFNDAEIKEAKKEPDMEKIKAQIRAKKNK